MGKGKVAQKGKTRKRPEASEDSEAGKIAVSEVAGWVPLDQVEHAKCVKNRKGTPTSANYVDLITASELG